MHSFIGRWSFWIINFATYRVFICLPIIAFHTDHLIDLLISQKKMVQNSKTIPGRETGSKFSSIVRAVGGRDHRIRRNIEGGVSLGCVVSKDTFCHLAYSKTWKKYQFKIKFRGNKFLNNLEIGERLSLYRKLISCVVFFVPSLLPE